MPLMRIATTKAYGDCNGPFGFPMLSDAARELEHLLKTLPKECREKGLCRQVMETKAADFEDGEMVDVSFVTTETVDRDREVVLAKGLDWGQFRKNPVVTWAHDYSAIPMGRALWVKKETKGSVEGWKAKTRYTPRPPEELLPKEAEWFPSIVYHLVKMGDLRGKSIGFLPLNMRPAEEKEIRANPAWAKSRAIIDKAMVIEYAIAPVPANPDALVDSVSKLKAKGMAVPGKLLDSMGYIVPDDIGSIEDLPPAGFTSQEDPIDKALRELEARVRQAPVMPPASKVLELLRKRMAEPGRQLDIDGLVRNQLERLRGRV